jgi:hypothetical protein
MVKVLVRFRSDGRVGDGVVCRYSVEYYGRCGGRTVRVLGEAAGERECQGNSGATFPIKISASYDWWFAARGNLRHNIRFWVAGDKSCRPIKYCQHLFKTTIHQTSVNNTSNHNHGATIYSARASCEQRTFPPLLRLRHPRLHCLPCRPQRSQATPIQEPERTTCCLPLVPLPRKHRSLWH